MGIANNNDSNMDGLGRTKARVFAVEQLYTGIRYARNIDTMQCMYTRTHYTNVIIYYYRDGYSFLSRSRGAEDPTKSGKHKSCVASSAGGGGGGGKADSAEIPSVDTTRQRAPYYRRGGGGKRVTSVGDE